MSLLPELADSPGMKSDSIGSFVALGARRFAAEKGEAAVSIDLRSPIICLDSRLKQLQSYQCLLTAILI